MIGAVIGDIAGPRFEEDAIRNAVSIGGDSDMLAAISGSVAEAYYGVPDKIRERAYTFWMGVCRGF